MKTMWTEVRVRQVIPEALRVLAATEGRVGPRRVLTNWPDMALEWHELVSMNEVGSGYRAKMSRRSPTAAEIERADIVLLGFRHRGVEYPGFLNGSVMAYPLQREKLILASIVRSRKQSERSLCRATGWNLSTFQNQRAFAARVVADWLNGANYPSW